MDAKEKLDLQAELDHLEIVRQNRHENAWEIDRINVICAKLENTDWFTRDEQNIIVSALAGQQRELQEMKEVLDQAVHQGIIAIANRIYYAQNETERAEIMQAYAEWYHEQCVKDQNLAHINRVIATEQRDYTRRMDQDERMARSEGYPEHEEPQEDPDDMPF